MTEAPTAPEPTAPGPGNGPIAGRPPYPPPVYAGWAVASLLFFWPLSFSAFTHAFNVYPLWASGDYAAAQHASERVRRLGQLSLWLFGGLLLLFVILYTIVTVVLIASDGSGYGMGDSYHALPRPA